MVDDGLARDAERLARYEGFDAPARPCRRGPQTLLS
jgi:hypothetical protein